MSLFQRPSDQRVPFIAAFTLLIVLAFSDEFLSATLDAIEIRDDYRWLVVPVDAIILLITLWQKHRFRKRAGGQHGRLILPWWLLGAALTLMLDVSVTVLAPPKILWLDLVSSPMYVIALAVLLAATVDASPLLFMSARRRLSRSNEWVRVRVAVPLLIGTLGAYFTTSWWEYWLAGPGVDQEFFAQMSQVIALLIVALGVEVQFFRAAASDPGQRAMAILSLSILSLGEIMALSALTRDSTDNLYEWHAYLAFLITVEACLIALATLIWVLIVRRDAPVDEPVVAPPAVAIEKPALNRASTLQETAVIATMGLAAVAVVAVFGLGRRRR